MYVINVYNCTLGIKDNEKADSVLDLPCVKVGVPNTILNIILTDIIFPLGKLIDTVRSRTSFIMSSQSWGIGSPSTGDEVAASVYSDSSPHFGGVQSSRSKKK